MKHFSHKYSTLTLASFATLLFFAGCANVTGNRNNTDAATSNANTSEANRITDREIDTSTWKNYKNVNQTFQVVYPENWYATEIPVEEKFELLLSSYKPADDDIHDAILISKSDKSIIDHLKQDKELLGDYRQSTFHGYTLSQGYNELETLIITAYIPMNGSVFEVSLDALSPEKKYFETVFPYVVDSLTYFSGSYSGMPGHGFVFTYPSNWRLEQKKAKSGVFQSDVASQQWAVDDPKSPYKGVEYFDSCNLSIFPADTKTNLRDWIKNSGIYTSEGEGVYNAGMKDISLNGISAVQVDEGAPSATQSKSVYFHSGGDIIRYGYFTDLDIEQPEVLKDYADKCENIQKSIKLNE